MFDYVHKHGLTMLDLIEYYIWFMCVILFCFVWSCISSSWVLMNKPHRIIVLDMFSSTIGPLQLSGATCSLKLMKKKYMTKQNKTKTYTWINYFDSQPGVRVYQFFKTSNQQRMVDNHGWNWRRIKSNGWNCHDCIEYVQLEWKITLSSMCGLITPIILTWKLSNVIHHDIQLSKNHNEKPAVVDDGWNHQQNHINYMPLP